MVQLTTASPYTEIGVYVKKLGHFMFTTRLTCNSPFLIEHKRSNIMYLHKHSANDEVEQVLITMQAHYVSWSPIRT